MDGIDGASQPYSVLDRDDRRTVRSCTKSGRARCGGGQCLGEKIPYATITVIGTTRGAVTNNNGFYLIANLPHGTYQIIATSLGYDAAARTITVRGKEPLTLNFSIISRPVEQNEVVVTGGRKRELEEISTSVHVLDQRELQKVPVAAQADLFRSIQIIPGHRLIGGCQFEILCAGRGWGPEFDLLRRDEDL
jgi:hypothetical protein